MSAPKMYAELARFWQLVSPPEDYADEASHWKAALRAHLGPGRHRLLELGVGGGNNLSHLTDEFDAEAVDLSVGMLAHSRRLNPAVRHHVGDMRSVHLGRTFDAVIAHDAVSYLASEDDLRRTFATAAAHLGPGGLFVCAPDWHRESFRGPTVQVHGPRGDAASDAGEITFLEMTHDPDPSDTTIEVVYVFLRRRRGVVEVTEDRHTLGLFPVATWERLLEESGFRAGRHPYPVHEDGHEGWLHTGVLRETKRGTRRRAAPVRSKAAGGRTSGTSRAPAPSPRRRARRARRR